MARPLRDLYEGALYHVRSKGNRVLFLRTLGDTLDRYSFRCHSYCLMSNHFHLLVETPLGNLSSGMQYLNGIYTQVFNLKHTRVGHLFQGRYWARLISDEPDLLEVVRYISLNPVRAGITSTPDKYRWSSFRAICGLPSFERLVDGSLVLSYFRDGARSPEEEFTAFVLEGLGKEAQGKPIPLFRLIQRDAAIGDLEEAICDAFCEHGHSQREIARFLDLHHSKIARIIRRHADRCANGV
jgi:putative transposase